MRVQSHVVVGSASVGWSVREAVSLYHHGGTSLLRTDVLDTALPRRP
jgi:hypothetical protein